MHRLHRFTLALWLGIALGANALAQPVAGLVRVTQQGQATFFFVDPLPANQDVSIQTPAANGAGFDCCTRVPRHELKAMDSVPEQVTSGAGRAVASYVLQRPLTGQWGDSGFLGVAMAAPTILHGGRYAVLGKEGRKVTRARLCYGVEGLNMIATRGSKVSSLYFAFGVEVDEAPKCSARDERDLGHVNH